MARVFSWIIEGESKTGYAYITNGNIQDETPVIYSTKLDESSEDFKKIYYRANDLSLTEYEQLFNQMKAMVDIEFDGSNIIDGTYEDYFGENENYILLSGLNGTNGTDGKSVRYEYKYYTFENESHFNKFINTYRSCSTDEEKNSLIENGGNGFGTWTDKPIGITSDNTIEAVSQRIQEDDKVGIWEEPVIWSKWGRDGKDGDTTEYIYLLTQDESVKPKGFFADEEGNTLAIEDPNYNTVDYLPYSKVNDIFEQWSDDPRGISLEKRAQWCSFRKNENESGWTVFSEPILWGRYGADGTNGKDGKDGTNGVDGSGLNVYLTNQCVDVYPKADNPDELDYSDAVSDIVVMNGANEVTDATLEFEGFTSPLQNHHYVSKNGDLEFDIVDSVQVHERKAIQITKITKKGRTYIPIFAKSGAIIDSTTMEIDLDYDGRIKVSFNTNIYRYEYKGAETPIDTETITLKANYYGDFNSENTWWESIDKNGIWQKLEETGDTLEVTYNSELWDGRDEIFIRRYGEIKIDEAVQETDYDIVSLFKVYNGKNGENGKDGAAGAGLSVILSNPVCDVYPVLNVQGEEEISLKDAITKVSVYNGAEEIESTNYTLKPMNSSEWTESNGEYVGKYATLKIENGSIKLIKFITPWEGMLSVPFEATYNGVKAVAAWLIDYDTDGNRISISSNANVFIEKNNTFNIDSIEFTVNYDGCFNSGNTVWLVEDNTQNNPEYGGYWKKVDDADVSSDNVFTLSREKYMTNKNSLRVRNYGKSKIDTSITDYDEITIIKVREGKDGESTAFVEYIYKRYQTTGITEDNNLPNTWDTSQEDGYAGDVAYGWKNSPQGITPEYRYEFIAKRERKDGAWQKFEKPVLWAAWGEKGNDGSSVEYIFFRTEEENAPKIDAYDKSGSDYQKDDYLPTTNGEKWSDDPLSVSEEYPFQWVSERKKVNGIWDDFSQPALWSRVGRDGAAGQTGAIYRYKGEWNSATTYVHNTEFIDYVSYGNTMDSKPDSPMIQYWSLNNGLEGTGQDLGGIPSGNTNWTAFFTAESIATNFLLTDQVKSNIITATKAQIDEVSANTINAVEAKINQVSADTLTAAEAIIGEVSANTLNVATAQIKALSANTVSANNAIIDEIKANKAEIDDLKTRKITVEELYAVATGKTEDDSEQGAKIDASNFLLFYSSSTVDSRVYLQIMPEYTIPAESDDIGDYFTEGETLYNVPVLVMEYATSSGKIKRFLDPFISWKAYDKKETISYTWLPVEAYEGRSGLTLGNKVTNLYLVKSSDGRYVTNSDGNVCLYTFNGQPLSTDVPTTVYAGKKIYVPGVKNQKIASNWKEAFRVDLSTFETTNLCNESWVKKSEDQKILVGKGSSEVPDSHDNGYMINSGNCPFTMYKINFNNYTISRTGAITKGQDESEYYFALGVYKTNSIYDTTHFCYMIKTDLTGDTIEKNTSKPIAGTGAWSSSTYNIFQIESESNSVDTNTFMKYNIDAPDVPISKPSLSEAYVAIMDYNENEGLKERQSFYAIGDNNVWVENSGNDATFYLGGITREY